ncbi:MAG: hypothetical protein ACOY4K_01435 [Pseudomonadota bacterium]
MRPAAVLLVLALAVAAPSAAQEMGRIGSVSPPAAALRGPMEAAPKPPADLAVPAPALPAAPIRVADGSRQCRLACARAYYFCLADEADICAPNWSRCTARCGTP